jgi:radical SAM superfamily enzyme YgiQ (UPF0313 family)
MYFDEAEGMVFRPPNEADSLIIRATIGCSHNACSFCAMYKSQPFRKRSLAEINHLITCAQTAVPNVRRVFLADGNALTIETETLLTILNNLRTAFPRLTRVGMYANAKDILHKTSADLVALHKAGVKIVYMGIESGDPVILKHCNKGISPEQMIEAGEKLYNAGIKLSATVILGLGGKEHTAQHALHTARIINAIRPTMVGALSLMVYPDTPLANDIIAGKFTPLSTPEIIEEQFRLLKEINVQTPCIYRSNHASNYIPLAGTLPKDKNALLTFLQTSLSNAKIPSLYAYKE